MGVLGFLPPHRGTGNWKIPKEVQEAHFSKYSQTKESKSVTLIIGEPGIKTCAKKTVLQQIILNHCLDIRDFVDH